MTGGQLIDWYAGHSRYNRRNVVGCDRVVEQRALAIRACPSLSFLGKLGFEARNDGVSELSGAAEVVFSLLVIS